MSYVDSASYDAPTTTASNGPTAGNTGGLDITHGVLALFLIFLGLFMLASYGVFRKINNAL